MIPVVSRLVITGHDRLYNTKIINTLYSIPNDRSIGELPLFCFDTSKPLLPTVSEE